MIKIEVLNDTHNADELVALSRQFFAEYESNHSYFFDIDEILPEQVLSYFRSFIDMPNKRAWVALANGKIVAYLTAYIKDQPPFYRVKRIGDISGLMVAQAYRKQGLATRLMEVAKRFFAENGVQHYVVFTASENIAALDFYRKQGMTDLYVTLLGESDV